MKIRVLVGLVAVTLGGPTLAYGQASEIAALRAEVAALTSRLVALESRQDDVETAPTPPAAPSNALDGFKLKADLRYRHESIDQQGSVRRDRNRIRARIGVSGEVADNVEVGFQLATGGISPISANQSLDSSFSRKSIGLDLAYFNWKLSEQLRLAGGKIKNPFHRPGGNGLLWDSDLNPEGLALAMGGSGPLTASVAGLWVDERSGSSDSMLLGGQVAYSMALSHAAKLKVGAGYFDFLKVQGQTPFFGIGGGNLLDMNGSYPTDFNELELFAELSMQVAERPLAVFFDYVNNTEATAFDTGWAIGGKYGKASAPGTWEVGYTYQDLEANAVVATFADSDFGGGGTDGSGHIIKAGYALNKKMQLNLTYFLNERGADVGNKRDYNRLQADISFKY